MLYGKTKTLESYIHETIMKEQAKNRSTHSWLSNHSLPHCNPHNILNVRASGRIEIRRKLTIDGASKERNDGEYNKRVGKGGHDNKLQWSKWKQFWLEMMEKALDELQIYREKATCMHVGNGQWGEKRSKVSNLAALTRFLQGLLFRVNSICVATLKASWLDTKIKHAWQPTTPRAYQKEKNMREIMGGDFDLHVSKNKCILISLSFHIEKVSLTNKRMPS